MSGDALWSVKGIDPRARDAAREAARRAGLSLGDWLNRAILIDGDAGASERHQSYSGRSRQDSYEIDSSFEARPSEVSSTIQSLDRLAERIETAEARSALAITGIDQSVYALVARLDNAERGQKQYNAKLEGGLHELRATQTAVAERLRRMESEGGSSNEDIVALRSLEMALGNLALRVREVEEGSLDKGYIDTKLEAISHQVDIAAHEMRRVMERSDDLAAATQEVKTEVTGSVKELAERLTHAETVTDAAVRALRATVTDLDTRLSDAEQNTGPDAEALDSRLSSVTETVMRMIDAGREEVAREIASAFAMLKPGETDSALSDLQTRLAAAERRQLASFERIGSEIDRLANSLDQRLRGLEERNTDNGSDVGMVREEMARVVDVLDKRVQAVADRDMAAIQKMGEEMARFAEVVDERITGSEKLTADAIMQVGVQIEGVAARLQERQQTAIDDLVQKMHEQDAAAKDRLGAAMSGMSERLDTALSGVTQRLESVEHRADNSTLHQALEALSARIRAVESGSTGKTPTAFDSTAAKASVEPRVSGWGLFDGTPAAPAPAAVQEVTPPLLDDNQTDVSNERVYEGPYFSGGVKEEYEPLDILETDEQKTLAPEEALVSELPVFASRESLGSWDIDDIELEDVQFTPELEAEPAVLELEATTTPVDDDDLAALIEMLEAASGNQNAPVSPEFSGTVSEELDEEPLILTSSEPLLLAPSAAHVEEEVFALPAENLFDASALDFTRPEPTQEILPRGFDDEAADELLLTSGKTQSALKTTPETENEILELDPEIHEAIFGVSPDSAPYEASALTTPALALDPALEVSFDELLEELPDSALADVKPQAPAKPVDYLQQARQAALNSQSGVKRAGRNKPVQISAVSSGGGLSGAHVLAAAGVAAVAAIGAGSYFGHKLDAENIEQTLAHSAPRVNEVVAAPSTSAESAAPAVLETSSEQLAALDTVKASPVERFPEAAPTVAPESTKMAALVVPSVAGAAPVDAGPLYQKAVDSLRSGDAVNGAAMLQQAAAQGYAPAQYRLSKAYERGEGVSKNISEARRWTEKAAKAGNRKAMHDLAVYYAEGEDVRRDYVTAVEWFRKAADYGLSDSQYNLGVLFEQGLGVSQDEGEALYWFAIAGRAGDQDAARRARELETTIAPALVTAALRRADAFQPRKMDPAANSDAKRNAASVSYADGR